VGGRPLRGPRNSWLIHYRPLTWYAPPTSSVPSSRLACASSPLDRVGREFGRPPPSRGRPAPRQVSSFTTSSQRLAPGAERELPGGYTRLAQGAHTAARWRSSFLCWTCRVRHRDGTNTPVLHPCSVHPLPQRPQSPDGSPCRVDLARCRLPQLRRRGLVAVHLHGWRGQQGKIGGDAFITRTISRAPSIRYLCSIPLFARCTAFGFCVACRAATCLPLDLLRARHCVCADVP